MKAPAEKSSANPSGELRQSRTNARPSSQHATLQPASVGPMDISFADRHPVAATQSKLQTLANKSPQIQQLQAIQEMANNDQQTKNTSAWATLSSKSLPRPAQRHENSETGEPKQAVPEDIQAVEAKTGHVFATDSGSEAPPANIQPGAYTTAPVGSAKALRPISSSGTQLKRLGTAIPVIQMAVGAEKLKDLFNIDGVNNRSQFHGAIGKAAFDHFKKMFRKNT